MLLSPEAVDQEIERLMNDPSLQREVSEATYKQLKESVVSGREGSTFAELFLLSVVIPLAFFTRSVLTGLLINARVVAPASQPKQRFSLSDAVLFGVDFLCLAVVPLVAFALPTPTHVLGFAAAIVTAAVVILAVNSLLTSGSQRPGKNGSGTGDGRMGGGSLISIRSIAANYSGSSSGKPAPEFDSDSGSGDDESLAAIAGNIKLFITEYRTSIMLMTVVAILSVDFPCLFPRRHVKAEHYGVSLMDAGVGSFIFSHALTSPQARHQRSSTASGGGGGFVRTIIAVLRSVLPLLVLGSTRLFVIKSADYHEHVSEYGVHWNFFFTLAAVALGSTLVAPVLPVRYYALTGAALTAVYQYALSAGGLEEWIRNAPRTDSLIAANKEGATSAIGYFALYLIAVQIGSYLNSHPQAHTSERSNRSDQSQYQIWRTKVRSLLSIAVVLALASVFAHTSIQPTSRKMINASYVLFTLALNLVLVCAYLVSALLLRRPITCSSTLVSAINFNSLPVFLMSNLLTGAVNLSLRTLLQPVQIAFGVMVVYLFAVCVVATVCYRYQRRIKFW